MAVDRLDRTTATSRRCSSSSPGAARSPSPRAAGGSGCGTSPSGSTRPDIEPRSRPPRPPDRGTSAGCGRWASPARGDRGPGGAVHVGEVGEPATVDGTAGKWRVDPEPLGRPFEGRTALLSPFDRLVHDRIRARELFDFEYILEMYKPEAKRRWGYFALPILHGDRLVGKLDATADRKAGVLQVHALHEDVRLTKAMRADIRAEIDALASWLGLEDVVEE